ncbi:MAG: hypothetical protein WC538_02910 [Thermoanaerobaculia bacterium]|jgi:hypothetical protein
MQEAQSEVFALGSWDVTVAGVDHVVELVLDPNIGKTVVRVDGRTAARPISNEETAREFTIAGERWTAVRRGDKFEIELVEPLAVTPAKSSKASTDSVAKSSAVSGVVVKVIGVIVVLGLIGLLKGPVVDMMADWYEYRAPDGSFSFAMPVKPFEQHHSAVLKGSSVHLYDVATQDESCEYFVMYLQLPRNTEVGAMNGAINQIRDGIAKKFNATIDRDKETALGSEIVMRAPAGKRYKKAHDIKLRIVQQGPRIYFVGASVLKDKLGSINTMRFFMNFKATEMGYAEGPSR